MSLSFSAKKWTVGFKLIPNCLESLQVGCQFHLKLYSTRAKYHIAHPSALLFFRPEICFIWQIVNILVYLRPVYLCICGIYIYIIRHGANINYFHCQIKMDIIFTNIVISQLIIDTLFTTLLQISVNIMFLLPWGKMDRMRILPVFV